VDQQVRSPKRVGWVSLECVFQCEVLGLAAISLILEGLAKLGIHLNKHNGLLAYEEWVVPLDMEKGIELADFVAAIRERAVRYVIANLGGTVVDVEAPMSLSFHFARKIVVLSTPENMLWKMTDEVEKAEFSRLEAFSGLANCVAEVIRPIRSYIGPETFAETKPLEEMGLEPFGDRFFSNLRLRSLFEDYLRNYSHLGRS